MKDKRRNESPEQKLAVVGPLSEFDQKKRKSRSASKFLSQHKEWAKEFEKREKSIKEELKNTGKNDSAIYINNTGMFVTDSEDAMRIVIGGLSRTTKESIEEKTRVDALSSKYSTLRTIIPGLGKTISGDSISSTIVEGVKNALEPSLMSNKTGSYLEPCWSGYESTPAFRSHKQRHKWHRRQKARYDRWLKKKEIDELESEINTIVQREDLDWGGF